WVQKGADIDGEAAGDQSGVSVSMPDANTVAIGATQNGGTGIQAGHVRIYEWNGSAWVQKGADIDGEAAGDFSGTSVSMPDANTAAIGANGNDGNGNFSGHVRIYEWNGSTWVQKGIDIDGEAAAEHSGYSVSMPDPNTVAIGAPDPAISENNGRVRVFEWRCDAWVQKGMDMDGEAVTDQFGNSVSMPDANTVGIGGRQNDGFAFNAGHSRIFSISNLNQLTLSTDSTNAICGESNGSATVTPTGGTAPYTYLWDLSTASQTGSTATNLTAGIYSVTVTDSDCLTAIDSVEVLSSGGSAPDSIDITPSGTVILCPGDSVLLTAETGYETYNWSTLQTGEFIWASEPGEYTVSASNSLGCSSVSDFVIISQGSLPEASFTTEQPSGYLVEFTNTTSNGTEFEWTFPGATTTAQSPTFTFPFDGTYPVTLIASNSCGSDTITTNVEVLKLVGIHDIEVRGLSFEVLPNPSSGAVLLKGETTTPMIYALRVFNVIGQELSNERFTGSGSWVRSLDLGNAGKGVYFVVLENEKGRVSRRLLKL
ncbi:MAG: T9SS type A sorting domain-containing protein, partial [Bacteroidia bacterium]